MDYYKLYVRAMLTIKVNIKGLLRLFRIIPAILFLLACLAAPVTGEEVRADYLYSLSDFTGAVPYNWVRLAADRERKEMYVSNPSDLSVRIFNNSGMELYNFGDDGDLGYIKDLTLGENGDIFVLSGLGQDYSVIRANYRGERREKIALSNIPPAYSARFVPDRIIFREGALYLADTVSMKVLVTDQHGAYKTDYDLGVLLKLDEKKIRDSGIAGFTVDRDGDLLFTIPVHFQVYIVSPDRSVRGFGISGSSPGKFNIIAGIIADDRGNLYVTDTLRCVVGVFAKKDFTFKGEFGYRGFDPGNLIAPRELAFLDDKIYVTQSRNRGVSVFRITHQ